MAQQSIRMPMTIQITNFQNIINDLKKQLSNLEVGSKGFNAAEKVIDRLQDEVEKLYSYSGKEILSDRQFTEAEKSMSKIEDDLRQISSAANKITFSDLKLTDSQKASLKQIQDQIINLKNLKKATDESLKSTFMGSNLGKEWAKIDSKAATQSFDEITKAIKTKVTEQKKILDDAQKNYNDALKTQSTGEVFKKALSSSNPLESMMSKEQFEQFFGSKNGQLLFKSGQKPLFEQWLRSNFDIDDSTITEIMSYSADKINKGFLDSTSKLYKTFEDISKKAADVAATKKALDDSKSSYDKVGTIQESAEKAAGDYTKKYTELRNQSDAARQSLKDFQQACVDTAIAQMKAGSAAGTAQTGFSHLRDELNKTRSAFAQYQQTVNNFNAIKMAITNFMGFNQVINLTRTAVKAALNHIRELDTVMNKIAIVTDMNTSDLWQQIPAYTKMAQTYGASIKGAYEVSQIYYQQGLQTNDVLILTNETLKLAKISGLDYASTTDYMTTALRGFKMEMSEASTVVDVYSNLAAHTAVSQEELAVAMSKTASSMEGVGATFEETSAMIGTMVAVTRESATNIGSAMKSIASRYGELTKDPTKLVDEEGEAMAFNKVDAALQSVGISMRTVDGQFRDFTEVIVELGEKWSQLDSTQQRYIATQFAGNRQQSRFLALVSNIDLLKSNLDYAENSEDTGTLQALKSLDSIESKTEQVRVAYQQMYTDMGVESIWKGFLDGAKNVINTLNGLPKLFGKIPIGAIAMVSDFVTVIKDFGFKLLGGISKIWDKLLPENLPDNARKLAEETAKAYAEALSKQMGRENPGQTLVKDVQEEAEKERTDQNREAGNPQKQANAVGKTAVDETVKEVASATQAATDAEREATAKEKTAENAKQIADETERAAQFQTFFTSSFADKIKDIDFTQGIEKVGPAVQQISKEIMQAFRQANSEATNIGSMISKSVIIGMLQSIDPVKGTAERLAGAVLQGLHDGADMGSPSPTIIAMYQDGAGNAVKLGLEASMETVDAAAKELGLTVLDSLRDAMKKAGPGMEINLSELYGDKVDKVLFSEIISKQWTKTGEELNQLKAAYDRSLFEMDDEVEKAAEDKFKAKEAEFAHIKEVSARTQTIQYENIPTDNFIGAHNFDIQKLVSMATDFQGKIPSPSIALRFAADKPWDQYNNSTLFAPYDILDPTKGKSYLYTGDAYTPTLPWTDKKLTYENARKDLDSQPPIDEIHFNERLSDFIRDAISLQSLGQARDHLSQMVDHPFEYDKFYGNFFRTTQSRNDVKNAQEQGLLGSLATYYVEKGGFDQKKTGDYGTRKQENTISIHKALFDTINAMHQAEAVQEPFDFSEMLRENLYTQFKDRGIDVTTHFKDSNAQDLIDDLIQYGKFFQSNPGFDWAEVKPKKDLLLSEVPGALLPARHATRDFSTTDTANKAYAAGLNPNRTFFYSDKVEPDSPFGRLAMAKYMHQNVPGIAVNEHGPVLTGEYESLITKEDVFNNLPENILQGLPQETLDTINKLFETQIGQSLVNSIGAAFNNFDFNTIDVGPFEQLIAGCKDVIQNALADWGPMGQQTMEQVIAGLFVGFSAKKDQLDSAGTEAGQAIIEALNNGAGVHSPSIYAIITGAQIIEGLVQGLSENLSKAMKQGTDVGLQTVESIAEGAELNKDAFEELKTKLLEGLKTITGDGWTDEVKKEYEQLIKNTTFDQFKSGEANKDFYSFAQQRAQIIQNAAKFGTSQAELLRKNPTDKAMQDYTFADYDKDSKENNPEKQSKQFTQIEDVPVTYAKSEELTRIKDHYVDQFKAADAATTVDDVMEVLGGQFKKGQSKGNDKTSSKGTTKGSTSNAKREKKEKQEVAKIDKENNNAEIENSQKVVNAYKERIAVLNELLTLKQKINSTTNKEEKAELEKEFAGKVGEYQKKYKSTAKFETEDVINNQKSIYKGKLDKEARSIKRKKQIAEDKKKAEDARQAELKAAQNQEATQDNNGPGGNTPDQKFATATEPAGQLKFDLDNSDPSVIITVPIKPEPPEPKKIKEAVDQVDGQIEMDLSLVPKVETDQSSSKSTEPAKDGQAVKEQDKGKPLSSEVAESRAAQYEAINDVADNLADSAPEEAENEESEDNDPTGDKKAAKYEKIGNGLKDFGASLSMVSGLLDKSSQEGQLFSGVLSTIGGVAKTVGPIVQNILSGKGIPWMAVISGVITVINGISMMIEDDEERLERLTNEATELSNKSKEEKANLNILENGKKKLEELEKQRYKSAEAAEEYQSAVDDLAEKFPQLISSIDEAGNVVIDSTDMEYMLTKAREASAKATKDAAQAELKAAQEQQRQKYQELKETVDLNGLNDVEVSFYDAVSQIYSANIKRWIKENPDKIDADKAQDISQDLDFRGIDSRQTYEAYRKTLGIKEGYEITEADYEDSDKKLAFDITQAYQELKEFKDYNSQEARDVFKRLNNLLLQAADSKGTFFDKEAIDGYLENLGEIQQGISDYEDLKTLTDAYSAQVVSSWQTAAKGDSTYLTSSKYAGAMVARSLNQKGFDDYAKEHPKLFKTGADIERNDTNIEIIDEYGHYTEYAEAFFTNLTQQQIELFDKMAADTKNYSAEDFQREFGKIEGFEHFYTKTIVPYYQTGIDHIQERLAKQVEKAFKDDGKQLPRTKAELKARIQQVMQDAKTTAGERYLETVMDTYTSLDEDGFGDRAVTVATAGVEIFDKIKDLPENLDGQVLDLIEEHGITTIEGINKIISGVAGIGLPPEVQSAVKASLETIKNSIIPNVNLEIQVALTELIDTWEDTSKELSAALNGGVSLKGAQALIEKAKAFNVDIDLKDFQVSGDVLLLSEKKFEEYYTAMNGAAEASKTAWQGRLESATGLYSQLATRQIKKDNLTDDNKDILKSIGFNIDQEEYWRSSGSGALSFAGMRALRKAITESQDAFEDYDTAAKIAANQLLNAHNRNNGIYFYQNNQLDFEGLKTLAKSTTLTKDNIDGRAIQQQVNSVYGQLINDVLTKGIDKINLDDYQGLLDSDRGELEQALKSGNYEEFINRYAEFTGASIEQINQWRIEALDKMDTGKQQATVLEALSSAKLGDRLDISKLPQEIQAKFNANANGIAEITSEFARDSFILALDAADFAHDPQVQNWIREAQANIKSNRSKYAGIKGALNSTVDRNAAMTLLESEGLDTTGLSETALQSIMWTRGYSWDEYTQSYKATFRALTYANQKVQEAIDSNASPEVIAELQYEANRLATELKQDTFKDALENLLSNYSDVEQDVIDKFDAEAKAKGLNIDINKIIETQDDGTKKLLVDELKEKLGPEYSYLFDEIINQIKDQYIDNASKAASLVTQGTTSFAEMSGFTKAFKELVPEGAEQFSFFYDSVLKAWTFDPAQLRPYLKAAAQKIEGLNKEQRAQWVEDQIESMTVDNLDFSAYLSGTASSKDKATLKRQLETYAKTYLPDGTENIDEYAKQFVDNTLTTLSAGGEAAVAALKGIKGELSTEEIEAAYRAEVAPLVELSGMLGELQAGSIVAKNQIEALRTAGFSVSQDGLIQSTGNLVDAYKSLYEQMAKTNEATVAELNTVMGNYLDNRDGTQKVIDLLGNAANMTYSQLAELYSQLGVTLTEQMVDDMLNAGTLKALGGNKVMIADFAQFAQDNGLFAGSPEYTAAFKAYNDSLISMDRQAEKGILEEVKSITEARPGDRVNLTELSEHLGIALGQAIQFTGATLIDGILTIDENADIATVAAQIGVLAKENAGLIPEELGELQDAIDEYLKSITSLIQSGREGTLGNADKAQLERWAKQWNLQLDFSKTAEGFKLSYNSSVQLYDKLKDIDSISANLLLDDFNTSLDSAVSLTAQEADLLEKMASAGGLSEDDFNFVRSFNGNTDFFNRPILKDEMGNIKTYWSETMSSGPEDAIPWVMNITPIMPDGKELTEAEVNAYVDQLFTEANGDLAKVLELDKNDRKLIIDLQDATNKDQQGLIKQMESDAARLSRVSGQYHGVLDKRDNPNNARIQQYQKELDLNREIQRIRATTESDDFKFMDKAIPSGQNNPLNYFENWSKALKTFQESFDLKGEDKGTIGYQDFYNVITEMGNLAQMTGQAIPFGNEVLHNAQDASDLITRAAEALTITSDGSIKVDLSQFGLDFVGGAKEMGKNVQAGIEALAGTQIDMLDSMIQLLETIVAMEKLKDIDLNNSGTLDLGEIFNVEYDEEGNRKILDFTDKYEESVEKLLKWANSKEGKEFKDAAQKMKVDWEGGSTTVWELLNLQDKDIKKWDDKTKESYAKLMSGFYQAAMSNNWDLNNIFPSLKDILAGSGLDGTTLTLGDLTLKFKQGVVLERDKDGNYDVDGYKTKDEDAAIRAMKTSHIAFLQAAASRIDHDDDGNAIYTTDKVKVTTNYDVKNKTFTATFSDGGSVTADSQDALNIAIRTYLKAQEIDLTSNNTVSADNNVQKFSITLAGQATINYEITEVEGQTKIKRLGSQSASNEAEARIDTATKVIEQEIKNTKNETKEALGENNEEADKGATQNIKNEKNETGEAIQANILAAAIGVIQPIRAGINAVQTVIDENVKYAKDNSATQTITVKTVSDTDTAVSKPNQTVSTNGRRMATGNIGLAKAKGTSTLMGELGPELVVSNGRYFVAGQNGAEFVDLEEDAIVFNHLQTKQLLQNGMSPSRGKAITNERNAIAFAAGNMDGGPAQASASQALAALKQLRAMWKALQNASVSDLAGKAGGGGGGGGGNKDKTPERQAWIETVERWYNLMQQIAKLERDITHEEALRTKLSGEFKKNGSAYYLSQKKSLQAIEQQAQRQMQLNISQEEYFNQRRKALNESNFSRLYTFDENGVAQYNDSDLGLAWLADLVAKDEYGNTKYTNEEQYNMIVAQGFGAYMQQDSSGKLIEKAVDEEGNESEDQTAFYAASIDAWWETINSQKEEMESLRETIDEGKTKVLELEASRNEILKEIRDNQMKVEDNVMKALESSRQQQIDALSDERKALQDSTNKYIEGLNNALNKEREMYEQQENAEELNRLRRQLDILRRSGGSGSQIRSLEGDIASREKESYFDQQQSSIDAIKEASDLQLERLDRQIEVMTEALEYEKEFGLLWGEVYQVMALAPEQIAGYIYANDSSLWGASPLKTEEDFQQALFESAQWAAFYADQTNYYNDEVVRHADNLATMNDAVYGDGSKYNWGLFDSAMTDLYGRQWEAVADQYKDVFMKNYSKTGDITYATTEITNALNSMGRQMTSALDSAYSAYQAAQRAAEESGSGGDGGGSGSGSDGSSGSGGNGGSNWFERSVSAVASKANDIKATFGAVTTTVATAAQIVSAAQVAGVVGKLTAARATDKFTKFDAGGMVDEDKLALVHAKESVLTPKQTSILRNDILGSKPNSLMNLLLDFKEAHSGMASASTYDSIDRGVIIENASVNMNVQKISNDYDAQRAGEQALTQMLNIARRTSAKNSVRR